jgi:hypothetical protein
MMSNMNSIQKAMFFLILIHAGVWASAPPTATILITSPQEREIIQRNEQNEGFISVICEINTSVVSTGTVTLTLSTVEGDDSREIQRSTFAVVLMAPSFILNKVIKTTAGGWYRLNIKLETGHNELASSTI